MIFRIASSATPSMAKYVAVAVAAVIGLWGYDGATSAQQQSAPAGGGVRQACAADYRALCPGVEPGGGHIVACFRQHADQLSTGCKGALAAAKAARQKPASGS
jgi:hypothetical protein